MSPASSRTFHTTLPRVAGHIQVAHRVRTALDGRYPLTVLRAARGFGKTSVIVTWLRTTTDHIPTVYHALDSTSRTEPGFWGKLGEAMQRAGLELHPRTTDARQQVIDTLSDLDAPLRLVLDNMHEAGAAEPATTIDDDLVELTRHNERLYLVAAGRRGRELESVGALSVETVLLGPEDLKLDPARVMALAAELNVPVQAGCAERIAADIGGWPAAIRAGLTNATPQSAVDDTLVAGYLGAVLRDLHSEATRSFLLNTAVPESFDADLAAALVPEDQDGNALGDIQVAGLLRQEIGTDGTSRFRYPPAIRRALLRVLRETEPEREARIHHRLMRAAAASHAPVQALHHALGAEAWDMVTDVLERYWVHLLTSAPDLLVLLADQIPAQLATGDPRMRVLRRHRAVLADPELTPRTPWPVHEHPTMAADVIARIEQGGEQVDEEALALVLWAVACITGGNHDAATYAFNQARARGIATGSRTAVVICTVGLALVHALNGEPDLADQWLDEPELKALFPDTSSPAGVGTAPAPRDRDVVAASVSVARALAAVDQGAPDADHAVGALVTPHHRGDVWAMTLFARAHYVAVGDDPEDVFRQANQVRAALRHVMRGTLADTVLHSTLVELQLFAQMSGVALESAQQMAEDPIGWTTRAKAHLGRQEYQAAADYARRAIEAPRIARRSLLESHVIRAAALHGLGDNDAARNAFGESVVLARSTGQRRPFHLMRRYVFEILAGEDPDILRLWPGATPSRSTPRSTLEVELPTLTMREAQVLRALERHAGPVGIARSLDVSVNTVKTHLRSIYRKLGVSSRNAALDVLGRGGLSAPDGD